MLHPVGKLPAAVYWRRRALVLSLLLAVVGGGGWLGYAVLAGHAVPTRTAVAASSAVLAPVAVPSLDRVTPAVTAVRMPPTYGPCPDKALTVRVGAPPVVSAGAPVNFTLVVTNASALPCTRALDRSLQEVALLDAAGHRLWDSNDCPAHSASDTRTLAPRRPVSFPVQWTGTARVPACTGQPVAPVPGRYVVRGRLDTVTGPDVALTVG